MIGKTPVSEQDATEQPETPPTFELQTRFLSAYWLHGCVTIAAGEVGIPPGLHYDWLDIDPEYADEFRKYHSRWVDRLEEEARRRAALGVKTYKFHRGVLLEHPDEPGRPYYELTYSDTLLLALLKAERPWKYAERTQEVQGQLTEEEVAAMEKQYGIVYTPAVLPDEVEQQDDGGEQQEQQEQRE